MIDLDSAQALEEHRSIIKRKKFLNNIYKDFYFIFKNTKVPKGKRVEIGSGAGFIKKIIPTTVTSDVVRSKGIDKVIDSENIPYKDSSIAAFYMINTLHHIKNPKQAINEMQRCLIDGGKIVMVEPYNSLWGGFIYKNFHHETFDPNSKWKVAGERRMSDANGAIPWIIFERDRNIFQKKFPNLRINKLNPHTPFRYLLSGGLSKHQLLPDSLYSLIVKFENLISPLKHVLGMFVTIELEKVRNK